MASSPRAARARADALRRAKEGLSDAARAEVEATVAAWWPEGTELSDEAVEAVCDVVEAYAGDAFGYAAQYWEDAVGEASEVALTDVYSREWTRRELASSAEAASDAGHSIVARRLADHAARMVSRAAGDYVIRSARRGPRGRGGQVRFARVPGWSETCPWCLMLASRGWVYWSRETAGEFEHYHANCVTGETPVGGRGLVAALRREYEGPLVRMVTAGGNKVSVTPEHPILTERGWVNAGEIVEGDGLVCAPLGHRHEVGVPDVDDAYPTAEQVFEAARLVRATLGLAVPAPSEHFDGEAVTDCDVEVVPPYGLLRDALDALRAEPSEHLPLAGAGPVKGRETFAGKGVPRPLLVGNDASPDCGVGGFGLRPSLVGGHLGFADAVGLGVPAKVASGLGEPTGDGCPADTKALREVQDAFSTLVAFDDAFGHRDSLSSCLDAVSSQGSEDGARGNPDKGSDLGRLHPGLVEIDHVSVVETVRWHGYVYNLQTRGHWFTCENIVSHNCRCVVVASDEDHPALDGYDPDGLYDRYLKCREAVDGEIRRLEEELGLADWKTRNKEVTKAVVREMARREPEWLRGEVDSVPCVAEDGAEVLEKEERVRELLEQNGFKVYWKERRHDRKSPDLEIRGRPWDVKRPQGKDGKIGRQTIAHQFQEAMAQGARPIIDASLLIREGLCDFDTVLEQVARYVNWHFDTPTGRNVVVGEALVTDGERIVRVRATKR